MNRQHALAILSILVLFAGSASAGDYQAGIESPLRFGAGARELSLGGAALARCDGATAAFWNPARLASAEYYSLSGFHTRLFDTDVSFRYLGGTLPTLDFGVFGFGIQRLGVDNIERRDEDNLLLGSFSDNRLGIYLGYGRQMGAYEVGLSVHIEHHSLDNYKATSSPGLSLSLARSFGQLSSWLRDADAVVSVSNVIGSSVELDQEAVSQPVVVEAGFSCDLWPSAESDHHLELSTRLTKVDQIDIAGALGLEYTYAGTLSLRGGLRDSDISGGLGVGFRDFRFDYAVVNRDLGLLHMFSLTTSFGTSVADRRLRRSEEREADFQHQMNVQMIARNQQTVESLVGSGQTALSAGDLEQAVADFDRALFISRASGIDTLVLSKILTEATDRLKRTEEQEDYSSYLDSAQIHLESGDLLDARYLASLALDVRPESEDAEAILIEVNERLKSVRVQDEMIRTQIGQVDSLLTYGRFDEAMARAQSLREADPDNVVVNQLARRAEFESLRSRADRAFTVGNYDHALLLMTEAERLVPNHSWSATLRGRIAEARQLADAQVHAAAPLPPAEVSASIRHQVEKIYLDAQKLFESGALEDAIAGWERAEQLVPGFGSVRESLVKAYKYLGVERYGNNELEQAITMWRRAAELAPDNEEISTYIKRTESEIAKLREYTYEQ